MIHPVICHIKIKNPIDTFLSPWSSIYDRLMGHPVTIREKYYNILKHAKSDSRLLCYTLSGVFITNSFWFRWVFHYLFIYHPEMYNLLWQVTTSTIIITTSHHQQSPCAMTHSVQGVVLLDEQLWKGTINFRNFEMFLLDKIYIGSLDFLD